MLSRELDASTLIRVQSWEMPASVPARVEQALGATWPTLTGTTARGRAADIFCVGPTEWLVLASSAESAPLVRDLAQALEGSTIRATDLSAGLCRIRLEGARAQDLLAKACAVDVHPDRFPQGRCARTRFAGVPVVVHCDDTSAYDCIVARSYREYLLAWLADASLEFASY